MVTTRERSSSDPATHTMPMHMARPSTPNPAAVHPSGGTTPDVPLANPSLGPTVVANTTAPATSSSSRTARGTETITGPRTFLQELWNPSDIDFTPEQRVYWHMFRMVCVAFIIVWVVWIIEDAWRIYQSRACPRSAPFLSPEDSRKAIALLEKLRVDVERLLAQVEQLRAQLEKDKALRDALHKKITK